VATNLRFLDQIITHPCFKRGQYTTRFIDETPELFAAPARRDRCSPVAPSSRTRSASPRDEKPG